MWGKTSNRFDYGRLGAEVRAQEMERRGRVIKIYILVTYSFAAIVFLAYKYLTPDVISRFLTSSHTVSKPSMAATMDEKPFAGLRTRHARAKRKRSDSNWFVWGVARFQTPSFYIGVWTRDNPKHLAYDIQKQLRKYKTLTDWGDVRLDGKPEDFSTDIGRFQIQKFTYHPPAGDQNCVYFSSVNIAPGGYVRGNYCVAAVTSIDYDLLHCAISSVRHPDLKINAPEEAKGCNGRKIEMIKLSVQPKT
jgi:hypothetical protein